MNSVGTGNISASNIGYRSREVVDYADRSISVHVYSIQIHHTPLGCSNLGKRAISVKEDVYCRRGKYARSGHANYDENARFIGL